MTRHPFRLLFAIVAALALLLTACGGDDSADSTSTTAAPTEDASSADDPAETPDDTSTDDTAAPDADEGASGAFTSDECEQLANAFDQEQLSSAMTEGDDPTEELRRAAESLAAAADDVPEEIADDVATLAEVYEQLAAASAKVDWKGLQSGDPTAAMGAAELGQIYAANTDFMTAAQNLSAYAAEHCTPGG